MGAFYSTTTESFACKAYHASDHHFDSIDELPFRRPALSAARTGPVVPAHTGDDQEQLEFEREVREDALCPAPRCWGRGVLELPRRHSCLSHYRTPAGGLIARAGHPAASHRCKGAVFVRIAAAILARERQGLRPLVPETANRCPRVAG